MDRHFERTLWIVIIAIMVIGLVAVYSASYNNVRVSHKVFYGQLIATIIGIAFMFLLSNIDYRKYYDVAYVLYIANLLLLILVLSSGRYALGAKRWIEIAGLSFQPSELVKFSIILALARYFSQQRSALSSFSTSGGFATLWRELGIPLLITLVPMLLIFKQPDLGTTLLLFGIFIAILFASEISLRYFIGFAVVCCSLVPVIWNVMKPYQKERLLVFLNPNIDPLGAGYTIAQSKIAIGSGRLFGKGWLSGTQSQLNFLPERHTDFIFSVIGEEWGFLGTFLLIICFFILIYIGLTVTQQAKDRFGLLLGIGIVSIFVLQVVINIGMVLGLCPVVGLTLPFVSYGRSSFIVFVVMASILLSLCKRRMIF